MKFQEPTKEDSYYTRQEVADMLGISKTTVYHYAKQNKIRKIPNPHRIWRDARYYTEEVDLLAQQRKQQQIKGYTTSELSKQLGIPQHKIRLLIQENKLLVHEVPYGDERIRYSIPEETAQWIKQEIARTAPARGTRSEFYDSHLNIALYQKFTTADGKTETRLVRNEEGEWGFYSTSRSWIPYKKAIDELHYKPLYDLHRPLAKLNGYTDLILPKDNELSYVFLDYMYIRKGIENIRLREHEEHLALSIKAGPMQITDELPYVLTEEVIKSFLSGGAGEIIFHDEEWIFLSGYRKTTVELPVKMIERLQKIAETEQLSVSDLIYQSVEEFLKN